MDATVPSVLVESPDIRTCFQSSFDRAAFPFLHTLHKSPYFSYNAILDLAKRLMTGKNRYYIEEGETTPDKGWSIRQSRRSLQENLEEIAHTHSLVMLKRVHQEPEYAEILRRCTTELSDLTGTDIQKHYKDGLMTILVTSPYRVTPYHIDSEANLLLQIQGTKSVYIFDGNDRQVLPATELEGFWSGDIKAAVYKEHLQERAWHFKLTPGSGVHNPVIFPHWVRNGGEVSISLSINFKRVNNVSADVFRINSRLRRAGLNPTEPGRAQVVDHTKGMVYRTFRGVKHAVDSLKEKVS